MWTLASLAEAVGSTQTIESDQAVARFVIDSRACQTGDVFVAMTGQRVDGHDFIEDAFARGALAALVTEPPGRFKLSSKYCFQVDQMPATLSALARATRAMSRAKHVAITGSCGKTTVKHWLHQLCGQHLCTVSNPKSFNNHLGVPLTLLATRAQHQLVISEIGTDQPGEIEPLVRCVRPHIAVVTTVGTAHIGRFAARSALIEEKMALYTGLEPDGVGLIHADEDYSAYWQSRYPQLRTFGCHHQADYRLLSYALSGDHATLCADTPLGRYQCTLPPLPSHHAMNLLIVLAIAEQCGLPKDLIIQGLAKVSIPSRRGQVHRLPSAAVLIDDSYNANPESMRAAVEWLATWSGPRILVVGDMAHLGNQSQHHHQALGRLARACGLDGLWGIGDQAAWAVESFGSGGRHFSDHAQLFSALEACIRSPVVVLLKGSRMMELDRLVDDLLNQQSVQQAEQDRVSDG